MASHRNLRSSLIPRLAASTRLIPPGLALGLRPAIAGTLGLAPRMRKRLERNLRAGLGDEAFHPEQLRLYYQHIADLVAFSLAVYRSGMGKAGLERFWEIAPECEGYMSESLARGKGAVLVGPHLFGHEIMAGGNALRGVPVTVLARKAPDPGYEAVKARWYAALGLDVVHRPSKKDPMAGLAEMTGALRVLRKNRVLALTPDLIRKPGTGVPVTFLGRTVELPAGPFFLSARTGAPLLPTWCETRGHCYHIWMSEPRHLTPGDDLDAAVAAAAQDWATEFEAFLRRRPDMWQFWLDKRWEEWLVGR